MIKLPVAMGQAWWSGGKLSEIKKVGLNFSQDSEKYLAFTVLITHRIKQKYNILNSQCKFNINTK